MAFRYVQACRTIAKIQNGIPPASRSVTIAKPVLLVAKKASQIAKTRIPIARTRSRTVNQLFQLSVTLPHILNESAVEQQVLARESAKMAKRTGKSEILWLPVISCCRDRTPVSVAGK